MVDLNKAKTSDIGEDKPNESSQEKVDAIVNDVVDSVVQVEKEEKESAPKEQEQKVESEFEAEAESEVSEEDASQSESQEESDEEEDLIPKSKVNERIGKLTARIKTLEAENRSFKTKAPETKEDKLQRLNLEELKSLKRQSKLAQRKEQDDMRLEELIDLEDKVDEMIQNFPHRFQERQVKNLQSVLDDFAEIDPDVKKGKGELWNAANQIFQNSSALRSSEMGQVEAMMLATQHVQLKRSLSKGAENQSTLSRQVNNLKKKTSLEGKTRVQGDKGVDISKLRQKAKDGDMNDKENFFREALVPEDFLTI